MTKKSDRAKEVSEAYSSVGSPASRRSAEISATRRIEAVSLRLAGMTYEQIGERLGVSTAQASRLVKQSLESAENSVAQDMRDIENARLDRAQSAIWSNVLRGDLKSIDVFLRISTARRKLNGLDAPAKLDVNMTIREEMNQALADLEHLVLEGEIVEDSRKELASAETETIEANVATDVLNQTLEEVIQATRF